MERSKSLKVVIYLAKPSFYNVLVLLNPQGQKNQIKNVGSLDKKNKKKSNNLFMESQFLIKINWIKHFDQMSMALMEFSSALSSQISLALWASAQSQVMTTSLFGLFSLRYFVIDIYEPQHRLRDLSQNPIEVPDCKVIPSFLRSRILFHMI